jgi:ATP-dependent DNA helicase RecG
MNYKRHLLPLIEQGFIEMTIPEKPKSRLQKYRLTVKGEKQIKGGGL